MFIRPLALLLPLMIVLFESPCHGDAASSAREIFVSPTGSDSNPGTHDRPLASLDAARDAIRTWKSAGTLGGAVTVWLEADDYELTNPFELSAADSGSRSAPIVYRSVPGQNARLLGARRLKATDFQPVTDT
jgi:hypothetical protein